jgi:hypothetical protein
MDPLGKRERVDLAMQVALRQAIEAAADAQDFAGSYGPLEQGIEARAFAINPASGLLPRKHTSYGFMESHFRNGLHMQNTVIE